MNLSPVNWLVPSMRLFAAFAALVLVAGCDVYDRPNRPIPPEFKARLLDGTVVDRQTFQDKPWVVNVWVPG